MFHWASFLKLESRLEKYWSLVYPLFQLSTSSLLIPIRIEYEEELTYETSIGVLTDLVFDPFLIHFSFVFVDIDHQK